MPRAKNKTEIAADFIRRYPDAGNRTIARCLHTERPKVFLTIEDARKIVRYLRDAVGKGNGSPDKSLARPIGWQKTVMPKAICNPRKELHITSDARVLVISDLHVPYHDVAAVKAALSYGKKQRVDTILINGDFCDFYAISRHDKDPTRSFSDELEQCRKMLRHIRGRFPHARIIFKVGNHENRLERFMAKNAPVLLGISEFECSSLLQLDKLNIEYVPSLGLTFLGKLPVYHGHELPQGTSSPVNPARGIWNKVGDSMMCGHWHRSSTHTEKVGIDRKVKSCWSLGCLCDMEPDYCPINKWSHGCAFVLVNEDGSYEVVNKLIRDGRLL